MRKRKKHITCILKKILEHKKLHKRTKTLFLVFFGVVFLFVLMGSSFSDKIFVMWVLCVLACIELMSMSCMLWVRVRGTCAAKKFYSSPNNTNFLLSSTPLSTIHLPFVCVLFGISFFLLFFLLKYTSYAWCILYITKVMLLIK